MSEQLIFDTGLPDALRELGREAFVASRDVRVVLSRLPVKYRGVFAVGLTGTSAIDKAGHQVAPYRWAIRRDWDEDKGEHVNFTTQSSGKNIAFVKRSQRNPPWGPDIFIGNIVRFSTRTGWQDARDGYGRSNEDEKRRILSACGRVGKDEWLRVMGWSAG